VAGVEGKLHALFLTTALDADRSQLHDPAFLTPPDLDGPQRLFDHCTEERLFLPTSANEEKLLSCPVRSLVTIPT